MNRSLAMCRRTLLVSVICSPCISAVHAQYSAGPEVTLESQYLRVKLAPEPGGAITSLLIKEHGCKRFTLAVLPGLFTSAMSCLLMGKATPTFTSA